MPHSQIQPPDIFHVTAAVGWLELGNATEAAAELDQLPAATRSHPDVLEIRWQIHAARQEWDNCRQLALALTDADPERTSGWINLAYAVRRATGGSLEQAAEILTRVADKFPADLIIPFNLACYHCQLGQLDGARLWLTTAFNRAIAVNQLESLRTMTLAEKDLEPLWQEMTRNPSWFPKKSE